MYFLSLSLNKSPGFIALHISQEATPGHEMYNDVSPRLAHPNSKLMDPVETRKKVFRQIGSIWFQHSDDFSQIRVILRKLKIVWGNFKNVICHKRRVKEIANSDQWKQVCRIICQAQRNHLWSWLFNAACVERLHLLNLLQVLHKRHFSFSWVLWGRPTTGEIIQQLACESSARLLSAPLPQSPLGAQEEHSHSQSESQSFDEVSRRDYLCGCYL